jgi:hypothetical protein
LLRVTLAQTHHLPALDVHGGKELHRCGET